MDKMFTHNMKRRKIWIKCLCRICNILHKIKMYKLVTDKLSVIVETKMYEMFRHNYRLEI